MAKLQGFLKLPRWFLLKLAKLELSGLELAVMLVIVHKLYGWHKSEDKISASNIAIDLGMTGDRKKMHSNLNMIHRALKSLQIKKAILKRGNGLKRPCIISIHPSLDCNLKPEKKSVRYISKSDQDRINSRHLYDAQRAIDSVGMTTTTTDVKTANSNDGHIKIIEHNNNKDTNKDNSLW